MQMRPTIIGAAIAIAALMPMAAIAKGPVKIVAAENFYGDVARQIGRSHVAVTSILANPDQDPHLFEASPSTARRIADAEIVIYNGAGYDPWMDKLLSAAPDPRRAAIVAARLTGHKAGDNPHIWYDPATLPAVASALAAELARRDPADAAAYRVNLAAFEASMKAIDGSVAALRKAHAGAPVTATEPVFGYMAEALGFRMLNDGFQRAVMNGTEPGPSEVAAFEKTLSSRHVKILFYNAQVADAATARLIRLAKANKVAVIGVSETEPEGATVQTWLGGLVEAIRKALETR